MSASVTNQASYLRTSRNFPEADAKQLSVEINRAYIDVANAVNSRTISLFPTNRPVVTGENWYLVKNQRQQGFRQIYPFTSTAAINHGIQPIDVAQFTKCSGSYTDGTNWYGAIYASNVAIAGQITFYVTPTQIIILAGAGAPAITNGTIVIEWISQP